MVYKLELPIKLISLLAPFVVFLFPSGPFNSESPLALLVCAFPYLVIFAFTHFVKHKSRKLLIATATLLVLLVLSSLSMIFGTGSDPQSSIGLFWQRFYLLVYSQLFAQLKATYITNRCSRSQAPWDNNTWAQSLRSKF